MNERNSRPALWIITAVVAALLIAAVILTAYNVFGPRPTDFVPGKRVALSAYQGQDPTGVPAALRSAGLIERGEYLARAADCAACHTGESGAPYAGGRAFVLPFGTLYSTNITPDANSGIGRYSDTEFIDAIHKGIGRGHKRLYPAMPYPSYTYMSDADALAIKAYLFSLPPVHAAAPENTLIFPFNQRRLMAVWSLLFNPGVRFDPNSERNAQWNRGAYLAEALGHCGECHTPRNLFFALNNRQKYAGALQAGWRAYNITQNRDAGVGTWSDAELVQYLSRGHADGRGTAAGPMGEAVEDSLRYLQPDDVAALVVYLRSVPSMASTELPPLRTSAAPDTPADEQTVRVDPHGRAVYEGACVGCHGWTGESPVLPLATLTGTRAVNDPTAVNVAQIIISGGPRRTTNDPNNMPAFGSTYSDEEIASAANYVTARFGAKGSSLSPAAVAKLRSEE